MVRFFFCLPFWNLITIYTKQSSKNICIEKKEQFGYLVSEQSCHVFQQVNLTWACDAIRKPALGQRSISQKHVTLMSCKLEPAIWSRDTGQQIPCFDRLNGHIIECPISKKFTVNQGCMSLFWSMAAMLGNSIVIVVRMHLWTIPLAMITMRKSTRGFPFLSHDVYGMGLHLAAL